MEIDKKAGTRRKITISRRKGILKMSCYVLERNRVRHREDRDTQREREREREKRERERERERKREEI